MLKIFSYIYYRTIKVRFLPTKEEAKGNFRAITGQNAFIHTIGALVTDIAVSYMLVFHDTYLYTEKIRWVSIVASFVLLIIPDFILDGYMTRQREKIIQQWQGESKTLHWVGGLLVVLYYVMIWSAWIIITAHQIIEADSI